MTNQVDVLLTQIGTGKWNIFHFVAAGLATGMPASHALAGAFVVPRIEHTCRQPLSKSEENIYINDSTKNSCSYWIRNEDGNLMKEEACSEWNFDNSTFTSTITSEFDLVCQKEYIRALYSSLYMIGVLVASPSIGYLSDRFGRKTTFVAGMIAFMFLSIISCWLPNIPSILFFRFLIGICHVPVVKISYILGMEVTSPKVRSLVCVLMWVPWTLYTLALTGMAYFIREWRWLLFGISLTSWAMLPALWFLDESPHWLVVRGQYTRALQVLKKAARWNNVSLPPDDEIIYRLKEHNAATQKVKGTEAQQSWKEYAMNLFILYRTPRLRTISLVMHLAYFVYGMVFYGLAFSGGNFNMDLFSYMALMGALELPAQICISPMVSRVGRKIPFVVSFILSGVMLLCTAVVPAGKLWLVMTFTMLGRLNICVAKTLSYLYGTELFPTEVRTRGISNSFMMSRVGASLAPFIAEYLGHSYPWAPPVVFGGFAILAGLAAIALRETLGAALPDTIAYLETQPLRSTHIGIFKKIRNERQSGETDIKLTTSEEQQRLRERP